MQTAEEVAMQQGLAARAAMPALEQEVARMQNALIARMMSAIRAGTLSPEVALAGWQEYYSYMRLLKNLQTTIAMGTNAAEKLTPQMNLEGESNDE